MLRRGISERGILDALGAIMLALAIDAGISDRHGRVGDLIFAGAVFVALLLSLLQRIWPAAFPVKPRPAPASRAPKVYTARKRRAVGIVVVLIVYAMVRPDRNANLAVAAAYSAVFCGFVLAVMNVRKQHFVRVSRGLRGRQDRSDTDAFGRLRRDR
jgi:hypothetical protein